MLPREHSPETWLRGPLLAPPPPPPGHHSESTVLPTAVNQTTHSPGPLEGPSSARPLGLLFALSSSCLKSKPLQSRHPELRLPPISQPLLLPPGFPSRLVMLGLKDESEVCLGGGDHSLP